jgi:hypothetical protein
MRLISSGVRGVVTHPFDFTGGAFYRLKEGGTLFLEW